MAGTATVVLRQDTVDSLASLASIAEENPYRAPADMDLPRLKSILEARRAAVEDHIWSLREDPGDFAGTLLDYRDHSIFTLKDLNERSHSLVSAESEDELWPEIIKDVLTCAHVALETWTKWLPKPKTFVNSIRSVKTRSRWTRTYRTSSSRLS